MIFIDQTKLHTKKQSGNCLAASLASVLELPLSKIPEFENMGKKWFSKLTKWLETLGLYPVIWREEVVLPGYYFVIGQSPRDKKITHQVVYFNGKMIHDPHPSRDGIINIKETMVLVPFDPSLAQHKREQHSPIQSINLPTDLPKAIQQAKVRAGNRRLWIT